VFLRLDIGDLEGRHCNLKSGFVKTESVISIKTSLLGPIFEERFFTIERMFSWEDKFKRALG